MNIGPIQILVVALLILVLFGRGRISEMMGDFGKGIKSFRKGLNEDEAKPEVPPAQIDSQPAGEQAESKSADSSSTSN